MKSLKIIAAAVALLGAWGFAGQPASAGDNSSPLQLSIDQVIATFGSDGPGCDPGSDFITITGVNFDNGSKKKGQPPSDPVVKLANVLLEVCGTPTATEIVAMLPDNQPDGDYRLQVITGKSKLQSDNYDLTIGAVGPQGPQGPAGPAGISDYEIKLISISFNDRIRSAVAVCTGLKKVLGGGGDGFIAPGPVTLIQSSPYNVDQGWICQFENGAFGNPDIIVNANCYAICANVN